MQDSIRFLRCLQTKSALCFASPELIQQLNERIISGELTNRLGQAITVPIEAALVNESRSLAYAVIDDIPQMVLDEAIPLDQLQEG